MRHVICCWCVRDPDDFEKHVPVYFSGQRNQRLGLTNNIDILFLSGYGLLSYEYRDRLRQIGYQLHDMDAVFRELNTKYSALSRFGDYEKKCFLRWLVICSHFPEEPIIHCDGDILFNEDPAIIGKLLHGRMFVLQGCPVLTTITDQAWFSQYREQLTVFANDIEGYSATAWVERVGWENSAKGKWAGQRFRKIISSDQDLISHLIHTDRMVQDRPQAILKDLSSYIVFENPLYARL
jgi:hypothetical protein